MRRGGIMMWTGVFHAGKSEHVIINGTMNIERYWDEMSTPQFEPYLNHVLT